MNMNELCLDTSELKEKIQATIHHSYLCQYIEVPNIDEDKLLFLCSIADQEDPLYWEESVISALLVQIALDVHEQIVTIDQKSGNHDKIRQLTVLSGDYFSSLYYERLSNIGKIDLIRLLAKGIKEINEQKMTFFYANQLSFEQLIDSIRLIESGIVCYFSYAFREVHSIKLIQEFFLLKRLLKEKKQLTNRNFTQWLHTFSHHLIQEDKKGSQISLFKQQIFHKTSVAIDKGINTSLKKIMPLFAQVGNDKFTTILKQRLTQYIQETDDMKQLAEEGS